MLRRAKTPAPARDLDAEIDAVLARWDGRAADSHPIVGPPAPKTGTVRYYSTNSYDRPHTYYCSRFCGAKYGAGLIAAAATVVPCVVCAT